MKDNQHDLLAQCVLFIHKKFRTTTCANIAAQIIKEGGTQKAYPFIDLMNLEEYTRHHLATQLFNVPDLPHLPLEVIHYVASKLNPQVKEEFLTSMTTFLQRREKYEEMVAVFEEMKSGAYKEKWLIATLTDPVPNPSVPPPPEWFKAALVVMISDPTLQAKYAPTIGKSTKKI